MALTLGSGLILAWMAVAWHRFVLLEERPGLLPPLSGSRTLAYLGWSAFFTVTGGIILSWLVSLLLPGAIPVADGAEVSTGDLLPLMAWAFLSSWIGLRLGLVLPAAAVGRTLTLGDSWRATAPIPWAMAGIAVVWSAAYVVVAVLTPMLLGGWMTGGFDSLLLAAEPMAWAYIAAATLLNALIVLYGLSILTTLYGHLVERRPLG